MNPHKGWYHHYPDNHINKYQIARDADLLEFPGMDHLYIRLAWAYLEPKEGQFDWAVIDRIIEKWTAHGLGIAFRISCKETSTDRIEQQFATPRWVMEAGAKGGYYRMGKADRARTDRGSRSFDDPIFLAKLDRFLAAFAARYDGKPWLRYVDIGSIGDWGEGHSWAGSRKECGFAARKQHMWTFTSNISNARPLVVSDDFVYALANPAERAGAAPVCADQRHQLPRRQHPGERLSAGHERHASPCAARSSSPTPICGRRPCSSWSITAP